MYLTILWHLHQPVYRDPETGTYVLPWVNFHAVKNYYQMAYLTEEQEFPSTFNFVPCLLEQIQDYGCGNANDPHQRALEENPQKLTSHQVDLLRKFVPDRGDLKKLQMQALRSFFSPVIKVPTEKEDLLDLQKKILRELIPFFKRLKKKGLAEITTSAYYHPLLPLLVDLSSATEEKLPSLPFRHPEDAKTQLEKGGKYFHQIFGFSPQGLWPSEGGISQEAAEIISQTGFSYAVTDENILWKSLPTPRRPEGLFKPYKAGNLTIFFRDRELSDLLSFEFHKWPEKDAVSHFLTKLEKRTKLAPQNDICVLALDGENPWAGYRENAVPFLREFFSQIRASTKVTPILFEDYLSQNKVSQEISLVPGTWMGNFSKWVGHPAKNEAWETLSKARERCGPLEEILIAEGSDWFWWFGEENVAEFAFLFKSYIKKAYAVSGVKFSE